MRGSEQSDEGHDVQGLMPAPPLALASPLPHPQQASWQATTGFMAGYKRLQALIGGILFLPDPPFFLPSAGLCGFALWQPHMSPVVSMRYNYAYDVVVSSDAKGLIEYWSADDGHFPKDK